VHLVRFTISMQQAGRVLEKTKDSLVNVQGRLTTKLAGSTKTAVKVPV